MTQNNLFEERFFDDLWDPLTARKAMERLSVVHPTALEVLKCWPNQKKALMNFLTFSPISLEKICRRPELLDWLSHPDVLNPKDAFRQIRCWEVANADLPFGELRKWKSQEMLRIAYREITGMANFAETTQDITAIAAQCISEVYATCLESLSRRWGCPETGFVILAMGKFGGSELNYSSDIDVIFLYSVDGYLNPRFTYHEFFTRLAEQIVQVFSQTADPLFRIDLRLRPEGSSGSLVRSLTSMENYYAGYGETWERMALIKARGICGDQELIYEFNQRMQPFIFPRTVSTDLLDEIAEIKMRIERDIVGEEDLHRNVKLGYGGIREIEFIIQTLQLLHGAKHTFLQERNTLKALAALQELQILPPEEIWLLHEAYTFLRAVEHRLQIQSEHQTHTLPARREAWIGVAQTLGYSTVQEFADTLHAHTSAVRAVFDRLLKSREAAQKNPVDELRIFTNPEAADDALVALREGPSNVHIAPRTRRLYNKLKPELLRWCARAADPDVMLNRFVRFVDGYGIRGLLFETLLANPKLMELLVRLFDSSAIFSEVVIRRPQLIEEIARGKALGLALTKEQFRQGLERDDEALEPLDWVRVYLRTEEVRILLRDILGFALQEELQEEMTELAEACLEFCVVKGCQSEEITILAMGKFGGRELLYGADLDVAFIGRNVAAAERLIEAMAMKRAEGSVFPLDTRLRPEGQNGRLVIPLVAYREYFERRAQFWEVQALTKGRTVFGPESEALNAAVTEIWTAWSERPGARQQIYRMYERVIKERTKGSEQLHFKAGKGGLIAIEFVVQYLQMKEKIREPNTLRAIVQLGDVLAPEEVEVLRRTYQFLRRIESVLRRVNNSSVSELPSYERDQHFLSIQLGFANFSHFFKEYVAHRNAAEQVVKKYLYP
jgi:glutamate-ammonia-ligase adenylyltransferase